MKPPFKGKHALAYLTLIHPWFFAQKCFVVFPSPNITALILTTHALTGDVLEGVPHCSLVQRLNFPGWRTRQLVTPTSPSRPVHLGACLQHLIHGFTAMQRQLLTATTDLKETPPSFVIYQQILSSI